ncbi:MAG TPA: hypothetical protein VKD65_02480 [Candidatus Angelobacter sp.]|nr:hypothetical protein [Candidatus Angelobacter sp.]
MVRRLLQVASRALCIALMTQIGFAQGNSQGHGKGNPHNGDRASINITFGVHDREIIRNYFHGESSNLPPGLAKRGGNLPPGLQKHLERDGTLPPGLQKRITPFPVDLDRRLPRLPNPYHRVLLGQIGIILDRRTQRIMDIIQDVLNP